LPNNSRPNHTVMTRNKNSFHFFKSLFTTKHFTTEGTEYTEVKNNLKSFVTATLLMSVVQSLFFYSRQQINHKDHQKHINHRGHRAHRG
jgi:hypothetical protein